MDQAASDFEAKPERPKDQQDDDYSPEHDRDAVPSAGSLQTLRGRGCLFTAGNLSQSLLKYIHIWLLTTLEMAAFGCKAAIRPCL
jgi:hypothetical protein